MQVIIGNQVYEMNQKQANAVLKVSSEQISKGIYAIEKEDIIELQKKKYQSNPQLKNDVLELRKKGFKVYCNGIKTV